MNAREVALDIFLEAEKSGSSASALIADTLEKYDYEDPKEKAFLKRLAEGTLERRITLDWVLDGYSRTPTQKMKPLIRHLLRIGAYQILYMDKVPDAAACNEAVRLAKKRGFSSLSGFVNGVLRALSRNKEQLCWPDQKKDPVRYCSVYYSQPEWLVALWEEQMGLPDTEKMLKNMAKRRPLIIRVNETLSEKERREAIEAIRRAGVLVTEHPLYANAYKLDNCEGVAGLPGFDEGLFYVQDVSSMLAVEAAGIKEGMRVLDLCSAPGGKAILAAEKLNGTGMVKACDVSEKKTQRIRENAARMGAGNMEIAVWDARIKNPGQKEWADVMLADVPCSGLGVTGRKKDIRYRVTKEDLTALCALQKEILTASWEYVKPGGVLLYSTCTVDQKENEEMVVFLTEHFPFRTESLDPYLPERLRSARTAKGMLQLLPGEHDTDGFFIARLRRIDRAAEKED